MTNTNHIYKFEIRLQRGAHITGLHKMTKTTNTTKTNSFDLIRNELITLANVGIAKPKTTRAKTTIKPFNAQSAIEIRNFFKTFAYSFKLLKSKKLRDENGNLQRDENGDTITDKTPPYFTLYLLGNLNKRTVQSIAARINRKHRRNVS